ncbi:MAG: hypothetical protein WCR07_04635 [Verrucomicrobiota bacterium]|jgi:hypothetical protein
MAAFRPPGDCPACDGHVPAGRRACPHCGSSASDGWSDAAHADGLDLPDDEFDYDDFVARELGEGRPGRRKGRGPGTAWLWAWVALGLALVFAGAGWFALD